MGDAQKDQSNQACFMPLDCGTNSQGNDYYVLGDSEALGGAYRYINADGSIFCQNTDGSCYFQNSLGEGKYTAPCDNPRYKAAMKERQEKLNCKTTEQ